MPALIADFKHPNGAPLAGSSSVEPARRRPKHALSNPAFLSAGTLLLTLTVGLLCGQNLQTVPHAAAISIKPADFDRLIMSCYLGQSGLQYGSQQPGGLSSLSASPTSGYSAASAGQQVGRPAATAAGGYQQPAPYYGAVDSGRPGTRDGLAGLGQQMPRASTIDNFIALVGKIEAANPRLANNVDQLIRTLLSRFRMDNFYYDLRSRTPISDQDQRTTNIIPALLNPMGFGQQQQVQSQYLLGSDQFPEQLLDHDEKCSMYFMLSHFIEKTSPLNPPLASQPVSQLTGPFGGQRPPSLQAADSGYPARSAEQAFSGGASGSRYPGPSPSFGSPATANMNSFGSGVGNPDYTGKNPYGMNVPQPNNQLPPVSQSYNNLRQAGQYSKYSNPIQPPLIDGMARSRDERQATEYGVVTVANQDNAALVLNRVLMGILAAATPPQTIRQLSSLIYPIQSLTSTPKIDEELDPLYAVTLADLWAISSIPKAGKSFDVRQLADNGRWNDTMCPTSFQLERPNSIRFTTAELLGGLDGFNLGSFRRRLISMRRNLRLSEMLRLYYSSTGFRPQFAEVGVCNRATAINTQLDELHRQAENYLRLYQLNLPTSDGEIALSINKLDSFKETARQVANQFLPAELCQESSYNEPYPTSQQDQCEIAKADVVSVLDSSPQANDPFMNMVVAKLALKLGLSRQGNSLSVLTNQQDSTGYGGGSFNALVRNSTNTAEVGCALVYDTSRTYQGGQITDPTRLMEMFERALVNLDTEYLTRQTMGTSPYRQSSYVSALFGGQSDAGYMANGVAPKNTGGAKVIIWFSYGPQQRPTSPANMPTSWNSAQNSEQNQYRFYESKKFLRENFRGASILAVATHSEDVKPFVYNEGRDIFTDIPQGNNGANGDLYSDPAANQMLAGPADQLVGKLLQRMCDIPAIFQYPKCYELPSEGASSVGYISPGRKQYWMMSPKTFFASRFVRILFKVDGGRLRVCFGRMQKPDESAYKYNQQYQTGGISLGNNPAPFGNPSSGAISTTPPTSKSSDYYTGLEYGVCKDVSPGQEIDFIVSDPCYKKSIAECEPFYFVIRETSNPGEGDLNYMCKDEGCKRFDQVKFTMSHTGVSCSSAFKSVKANWFLTVISVAAALGMTGEAKHLARRVLGSAFKGLHTVAIVAILSSFLALQQVKAQQAVSDFGEGRYGEKRGNFTPSEILAIILLIMTIVTGLALTVGLCYYVAKRNSRGMEQVEKDGY